MRPRVVVISDDHAPVHEVELQQMIAAPVPARSNGLMARLAGAGPAFVLAVAASVAVLAAVHLVGQGSRAERIFDAVLPLSPDGPPAFAAVLSAVALVALAIGLRRGKRPSWELAVIVFGAAAFVQAVLLRHPIAGTIAAACLAVLLARRDRHAIRIGRPGRRIVALAGIAVLAAVGDVALALTFPSARASAATGLSAATGTLADVVSFNSVRPLAGLAGHGGLLTVATFAVQLPLAILALAALRPAPPLVASPAEAAQVDGIFRQHGRGALLPFQLGPDKQHLTTSEGAVVVVGRYGRFAVALGDPTGPAGSEHAAWAAFVASCRSRDEIPAVYQASSQSRADLLALGLRPFRVGHEAIVDLATFDLGGSRRANLRHTVTRARKGGAAFRFYPAGIPGREREALAPSMIAIDRAWSAAAGPRLGFTIGCFDPCELDRIAISVAADSDGAAIAFATFRPTGIDGGWVLDLLRRAPGGTPGALEGCLAEAASRLREAGAPTLSLGLAPLAGLDDASAVTEERGLARAGALVRRFYDVRGLAFFKGKFDPRWEPRYVALEHRRDLPALAIALVGLHVGGLRSVALNALAAALPARRGRPGRVPAAGRDMAA
jgi:phosphatidylglycerol lysyltransferase